MAPNLLWIADLTYINLIRRKRPGPDPRPRLRPATTHSRGPAVCQPGVLRTAQSAGLKSPAPAPGPLARRAEGKLDRPSNTNCSANSIPPRPHPGVAQPAHNIYIDSAFIAVALRPTTLAAAPDHPTEPTPPHEFFKASGNLSRASRKTAGRKVLVNFPSGHAMSSRRLFLSGLLSSGARLRFAGLTILPTQNAPRYR